MALYKGTVPALLLCSHGAVQFMSYEWLKSESQELLGRSLSSTDYFAIGAVAKIIASVTTYPAQVIKTRLQQREQVSGWVDEWLGGWGHRTPPAIPLIVQPGTTQDPAPDIRHPTSDTRHPTPGSR